MEYNNSHNVRCGEDVCVVGAGAIGLVAMKNLAEQGLTVRAFEKTTYVGGIWHVSDDMETTSALPWTRAMSSKYVSAFTDFPMPDEVPLHPSAKDFEAYLSSYARHFDLLKHIQFSTVVQRIKRNAEDSKWTISTRITITGEESDHNFSRVVVAIGNYNAKNEPLLKGIELFTGDVIHSRDFKDPSKYAGKNVLVVGLGPSGADTLCFLKDAGASKLYLGHRGPYYCLPRRIHGLSYDQYVTRRMASIFRHVIAVSPLLASFLASTVIRRVQNKAFPNGDLHQSLFAMERNERFLLHRVYFLSDNLPQYLVDDTVVRLPRIRQATGPHSIAFTDGTEVTGIDTIIFCTGYFQDLSMFQGPGDPTDSTLASDGFERLKKSKYYKPGETYPRLYRGFLSETYPESLAVLGHLLILIPSVFVTYDLVTMALASLWSGDSPLPSSEEMKNEINENYEIVVRTLERGPMPYLGLRVKDKAVYEWLNRMAGTGVNENLCNCGWKSFKLWRKDRKLHKLLMDGVDLPAVYRLFQTAKGRKPWNHALDYIKKVNEETRALSKSWKDEQTCTTT